MFWWMAWLRLLALSDVGQKISLIIYLFAEKATMFFFFLPDGSTLAIIIPWQGFDQMGCFRGSFRYGRILKVYIMREVLNPVTHVPPLTALDEPWPFFHFWRHHFWPKIGIIDTQLSKCKLTKNLFWEKNERKPVYFATQWLLLLVP